MVKPFNELRKRLLRAGVAPRHVRRYLAELDDHLADLRAEEVRAGLSREEAVAAAIVRLGTLDELTNAMIGQLRLRSWTARAPWAIFGLAPLFVLALTRLAAFFILWTGWQIFLPAADTPFGNIHVSGLGNLYFQLGRAIYFGGPFFIGWGISALAARQRLRAIWPVVGLALIACIAGSSYVQASRTAVPGGFGHIRVGLALAPSVNGISDSLIHAVVIFSLTVLPYLIWRWHEAHSLSA